MSASNFPSGWETVDELRRPFALAMGDTRTIHGLTITRRSTLGPNWSYEVRDGSRRYLIALFNPDPQTHVLRVWRRVLRQPDTLLLCSPLPVEGPEAALQRALDLVVHLRDEPDAVPGRPALGQSPCYATFTLTGAQLDPGTVTRTSGLHPSRRLPAEAVDALEDLARSSVRQWELSSRGQLTSADLAEHLRWLLDHIEPVRDRLPAWEPASAAQQKEEPNGVAGIISCFWTDRAQLPQFDAALLQRMATLDLDLAMDLYLWAEDDNAE